MKSNSKKLVGILGGVTILAIMLTSFVFAATSTNYSEETKKEYSFQTGIVNGSKYENAEGNDDFDYVPNYTEERKAEYSFQTGIANGSKYENTEGNDDFEYTPNWSEEKKAEYSFQTGKVNGVKNAE